MQFVPKEHEIYELSNGIYIASCKGGTKASKNYPTLPVVNFQPYTKQKTQLELDKLAH